MGRTQFLFKKPKQISRYVSIDKNKPKLVLWLLLYVTRPRGYKTGVHSQTQNKAQWLAVRGHVSANSQSLRFILSLRLYSSFITSRPGLCRCTGDQIYQQDTHSQPISWPILHPGSCFVFRFDKAGRGILDHTSFIAALLLPRDLAGWQDYLKVALSFRLWFQHENLL